eukprot:scaffold19422_cov63-Phaeocystis_antarctica.AAC.1
MPSPASATSPQKAMTQRPSSNMRPISPSLCQNPRPWEPFTSANATACMVHSLCSATDPHATSSTYPITMPITSMVTISTTSAVQVHEPRRWPRTVSSMRWTSTRPTRPSVVESTSMLSRGHRSGGTESAVHPMRARLRAIRKAWNGKAIRKSCAAKADSCEASAKAPVTGCIAMLAAAAVLGAAASRSGHRSGSWSLRGALASRSMAAVDRGSNLVEEWIDPFTRNVKKKASIDIRITPTTISESIDSNSPYARYTPPPRATAHGGRRYSGKRCRARNKTRKQHDTRKAVQNKRTAVAARCELAFITPSSSSVLVSPGTLGCRALVLRSAAISQTTAHMHGHHEATMGLAGASLGREFRALALSHTAPVQRGTA